MSKLEYKGDAVFSEKYEKDGETKTKYTNVGAWFQREDGSICIKFLNSWINLYDKRDRDQEPGAQKKTTEPVKKAEPVKDDIEDEIPF